MLYKLLGGKLRYVYQTILVNANVNKHTKVDNVANCSLQNHTFAQVFHFQNVATKDGLWHLVTWVASRLFQFRNNVAKCQLANAKFVCKFCVVLDDFG